MRIKSYASVLADDFINKQKNTLSVNEFRKTANHYKLWLLILENYHRNITTTMESIVIHLSKTSSRKTISTILTHLEKKELITKKKSITDNRILLIKPTERTVQEFNEWIHHFKFELNSVEG